MGITSPVSEFIVGSKEEILDLNFLSHTFHFSSLLHGLHKHQYQQKAKQINKKCNIFFLTEKSRRDETEVAKPFTKKRGKAGRFPYYSLPYLNKKICLGDVKFNDHRKIIPGTDTTILFCTRSGYKQEHLVNSWTSICLTQ